ncbi:oxidoreductase, partial [Klebsiella pneumoniae]
MLPTRSVRHTLLDADCKVGQDHCDCNLTPKTHQVSNPAIPREIKVKDGSLLLENTPECQNMAFLTRGGKAQNLTDPQHNTTM